MSGLSKQVVSWPLTGGLDTKNSPLSVVPGSHLVLDDVRQQRANEWRNRPGHTYDFTADTPSGLIVKAVRTPDGGLFALKSNSGSTDAAAIAYAPSLPAGSTRWAGLYSEHFRPCAWNRIAVGTANGAPDQVTVASGGGYKLTAWKNPSAAVNGIAMLLSSEEGIPAPQGSLVGAGNSNATRPRAVWSADRMLLLWYTPGGTINYHSWNTLTGALVTFAGTIKAGLHATDAYLDAIVYPGSTNITVVARTAADTFQFMEVVPTTGALATDITIAANCVNCLSLLPEPDSSGTRFVAIGRSAPDVHVLRLNSGGGILSDDTAMAATTATQITGTAYQAGASWMIVAQTASDILVAKKTTGVVSALANMTAAATAPYDAYYKLDSGAWREPGTDFLRFLIGIHGPAATDPQDTYYEMSISYSDGGAATVSQPMLEPQSRLLPLNAGPAKTTNASLCQAVRIATDTFILGLTRIARVSRKEITPANLYAVDRWTATYLSQSNLTSINSGEGATTRSSCFIPSGNLMQFAAGGKAFAHGSSAIPFIPLLTAGAGGAMTPLKTYQYITVIQMIDDNGDVWFGPPSIAASVTLGGAQNTVSVAAHVHILDYRFRVRSVQLYRTKGDGSVFQKVGELTNQAINAVVFNFNDTFSDADLGRGEFLSAEIPATITPALSHIAEFGGRLYGVDRDFPTQMWFTKKLRAGQSPQWVAAFQLSFEDSSGDITNLAPMDDKLVVFKEAAAHIVQGDGPDNTGAGAFPSITRVESDVGSIVGSPVVSTGKEVFFKAARGIHRMNLSLEVDFVGAPIDRWFNQDQIATPEVVTGAVFSSDTNEVRFQTTNYRFVYDRTFGIWIRDVGTNDAMGDVALTRIVNGKQVLFKTDGEMWFEGASSVSGDDGSTYNGRVRSAWIRPSGIYEQRMRLYQGRIVMTRTPGGGNVTPQLRVYYDNDDTLFETGAPSSVIPGAATLARGSFQPRRHRCSTFSLEAILPSGDTTLRLDAWAAEVGMKRGAFKNSAAERWT